MQEEPGLTSWLSRWILLTFESGWEISGPYPMNLDRFKSNLEAIPQEKNNNYYHPRELHAYNNITQHHK